MENIIKEQSLEKIKSLFVKAYNKNEIKEFLKGEKDYMIYPIGASQFIQPEKPGTGNLMYFAFEDSIIPVYKENPKMGINNKLINILNEMIFSDDISDFYSAVSAITCIVENNFQDDLDFNKNDLENILFNTRNKILEKEDILKNTPNFYGNISFYEEFNRMNEFIPENHKIL